MLFKDVPLKTRRVLLLYNVYWESALLVLSKTLLNSVNALLALSWRYVFVVVCSLFVFVSFLFYIVWWFWLFELQQDFRGGAKNIPTDNHARLMERKWLVRSLNCINLILTLKVPEKLQLYGLYVYCVVHICNFGMLRVKGIVKKKKKKKI